MPNNVNPSNQKKCKACFQIYTGDLAFCPNCGKQITDSINQKDPPSQADLSTSHTETDIFRSIRFYLTLLILNFFAAYILPIDAAWGMLFADIVIIVIATYWLSKDFELVRPYIEKIPSLKVFAGVTLAGLLTFGVAYFNTQLAIFLLGLRELMDMTDGTKEFFGADIPFPVLIFSIAIIPGVFEEVFFRGLVQGHLENHLSKNEAWIVQAIIFAIAHVNLIGFFSYLLLMGLYLGWLRNQTKNLIPGIVAHFTHNLLVLLQMHYFPEF